MTEIAYKESVTQIILIKKIAVNSGFVMKNSNIAPLLIELIGEDSL